MRLNSAVTDTAGVRTGHHLHFRCPGMCETERASHRGEQRARGRMTGSAGEKGGIDRDRQISSLLRYDLISARRRPLKIALRNPLPSRSFSVPLPPHCPVAILAAELRANLRLEVRLSSSRSRNRRGPEDRFNANGSVPRNNRRREREVWIIISRSARRKAENPPIDEFVMRIHSNISDLVSSRQKRLPYIV